MGTIGVIATTLKVYNLSWWWVLTLIPLAGVSVYLDRKHIAPGEVEAATKINPEWQKMMKMMEEIRVNSRISSDKSENG